MSHYDHGRYVEYRIRDDLQDNYAFDVTRAAGSKGRMDLIAIRPGETLLIQAKKSAHSDFGVEAWNALMDRARWIGAIPLLVYPDGRRGPVYKRLCEYREPRKRAAASASYSWRPNPPQSEADHHRLAVETGCGWCGSLTGDPRARMRFCVCGRTWSVKAGGCWVRADLLALAERHAATRQEAADA